MQGYQNPATPGGASYDNPATPSPVVPESPQSSGTGSYYGGGTSGFGIGSSDYMTPSPGVSPLTPSYSPQTPGSPMIGVCVKQITVCWDQSFRLFENGHLGSQIDPFLGSTVISNTHLMYMQCLMICCLPILKC